MGLDTSLKFLSTLILQSQDSVGCLIRETESGALRVTSSSCAVVWLFDGKTLSVTMPERVPEGTAPVREPGQGLVGGCFQSGESLISQDCRDDPKVFRFLEWRSGQPVRSVAVVPLTLAGRRIGVLAVGDARERVLGQREIGLLQMLGAFFGLAVHHCTYFPEFLPLWSLCLGMKDAFHSSAGAAPFPWVSLEGNLPKGISEPTLRAVCDCLARASGELSIAQVASGTGLSGVTARRYLSHLCNLGLVTRGTRYLEVGRPLHIFWLTPEQSRRIVGQSAGG